MGKSGKPQCWFVRTFEEKRGKKEKEERNALVVGRVCSCSPWRLDFLPRSLISKPSHQATKPPSPCPGTTRATKLASELPVKAWRKSTEERRRARSKPPRRLGPPSEQGAGYHHAAHSMGPARKQSRRVAQSTRVAIGAGATTSSRSAIATTTTTTVTTTTTTTTAASCGASDTKTLSNNTQ